MRVHVQGNIYLEADEFQFCLKQYTGAVDKRSGREKAKTIGYYTSLSGVIKKLIRLNMAHSEATTLLEMKQELERIHLWARSLFAEFEQEVVKHEVPGDKVEQIDGVLN